MGRWPAELARLANQSGFIGQSGQIIIGGPQLAEGELTTITAAIDAVLRLVAEIPTRIGLADLEQFTRSLGFPAAVADVISWSAGSPDSSSFGRADVIRTREGFQIVEINVGTTVGGMTLGSLPHVFGLDQPDSPLSGWARFMASRTSATQVGVILENAPEDSAYLRFANRMSEEMALLGHDRVVVRRPAELQWSGERLVSDACEIDWIYPVCFPEQILAERPVYCAMEDAIKARRVSMPVDLCSKALGSKAALAMLHELDRHGLLSTQESSLVKRYIPATLVHSSDTLTVARVDKANYLLKPSLGHGGVGVVVGSEVDDFTWSGALESALAEPHGTYVLQHICIAEPEPAVTASPAGQVSEFDARYVWGFYFADRQPCGTPVLRCRPLHGTAVINHSSGAAVGPLPPRSTW